MPSKDLLDRIAKIIAELPAVDDLVPGDREFDRWVSLSTADLHQQLICARESLSPVGESKFFLTLMQWSLRRAPRPFGLRGTTILLEARLRRILDSRDDCGRLTRVAGDQGDRDGLILFGRFVPIGIYHADVGAVPPSILKQLSFPDLAKLVRYLTLEMHGFGPALGIHLPKLAGQRLTERDFVEAHLEAAPLFENNPSLRGFFNSAWYYDPEVARISPHLAFLSNFACEHGALRLRLTHDADSVADATWKSDTRRRLHEKGAYVPTRYARLWSRRRFLAWARSFPTSD